MGIIGFERIASERRVWQRCFGMKVVVAEHKGTKRPQSDRVEFSPVLRRSDIISLHCALTDETTYLVGEAELRSMKRDAIVINCVRGRLVNNAALSRALTEKVIGDAGLDDVERELSSSSNPVLNLHEPNLMVTPHVAWASHRASRSFVSNWSRTRKRSPRARREM